MTGSLRQSSAESIEAMHNILWGTWHPGHDEVSLRYNDTLDRVEMRIVNTSRPNAEHKRPCILAVLEDAVERHNTALQDLLGTRDLRLVVETEDFPITGRNIRLPAFSMVWEEGCKDIPVPDFTFKCYPETRYTNSSWFNMSGLLDQRAGMVGWKARSNTLFSRGHWGVGPRRSLMPALAALAGNKTDLETLGVAVDVGDTKFVATSGNQFQWVDAWCNNKYLLHTAGFSYSAALKYRLACESLVFKVQSKWLEFYEPGLLPGVHYVALPPYEHEGGDAEKYIKEMGPILKKAVQESEGKAEAPAIAKAGKEWILKNLQEEGLSCYWFQAIKRYSELYFHEFPDIEDPSR